MGYEAMVVVLVRVMVIAHKLSSPIVTGWVHNVGDEATAVVLVRLADVG